MNTQKRQCGCCYEDFSDNDMITCTRNLEHKICAECVTGYIQSGLSEATTNNICIMSKTTKCGGHYNDNELCTLVPPDVFIKYLEMKEVNDTFALHNTLENYHSCPFCKQYGIQVEDLSISNINCQKCHKEWCIKCSREKHTGELCGVIRDNGGNLEDVVIKIRNEVADTINNAIMKKCPNCSRKYVKVGGCNAMRCTACHVESCYVCQMVTHNGHEHFYQKDAICKLISSDGKTSDQTSFEKFKTNEALKALFSKQTDSNIKVIMKREIDLHTKVKQPKRPKKGTFILVVISDVKFAKKKPKKRVRPTIIAATTNTKIYLPFYGYGDGLASSLVGKKRTDADYK